MVPAPKSRDLLRAIALDPKGQLRFLETPGGTFLDTNGHNFTTDANRREIESYKDSINELLKADYIVKKTENLYEITHMGYQFAEACSRTLVI